MLAARVTIIYAFRPARSAGTRVISMTSALSNNLSLKAPKN
jgi:hypothetical protein